MRTIRTIVCLTVLACTNVWSQWAQAVGLGNGTTLSSLVPEGSNVLAATNAGVYRSTDAGLHWDAANTGLTSIVKAVLVNGSTWYAGSYGLGVYASTTGGTSWIESNTGLGNTVVQSLALTSTTILAGTAAGVYATTDGGAHWNANTSGMGALTVYGLFVNGSTVLAGTNGGVYRATGGASWVHSDSGQTSSTVYAFTKVGSVLIAGTANGAFKSTDGGISWQEANVGLSSSLNVRSLTVSGANVFAGTYGGGVFLSTNSGTSWSAINTGTMGGEIVDALTTSGGFLIAGTNGSGAWSRPQADVVTLISNVESPQSFELTQNYPNPFNPTTVIQYAVAASMDAGGQTRVRLAVYDLLGKEVAVLINEEQPTGGQTARWNASSAPSGVYVYRLTAGSFTQMRKMVLLK